ncbi:ATP adenylyltransferase [Micractinium conductrix]|uniref:ATP adenylyltransferase n=1 Tax=Micractinium conductrix TaxID=554055 RepID=A0A2P6VHM5_9CHLO|nr:ATP adenylyltransferase [Micractinium conductrix]|eukprot:PSC73596.1 ATP adenylyltransferase [Micractinium conductrix]
MAGSVASASGAAATAADATTPAASAALWQAVTQRYDAAQRAAAATMTGTHTEVLEEGGVRWVLRVADKLRDKPKPPPAAAEGAPEKEWRNPFLPYEQALWVADLGAEHVLLLNKFNIVPWHCLVVTAQFQRQEEPLNAADWAATWAVMQCMPRGGLAFYNCGPASGASQPHKHVQVVPLPLDGTPSGSSADGSSSGADGSSHAAGAAKPPIWAAVAPVLQGAPPGQPVELRSLPFAAFAAALALPPAEDAAAGGSGGGGGATPVDERASAGSAAAAAAAVPAAAGAYLEGVFGCLLERCTAWLGCKTGRSGLTPQDGSLSYNMVCTRDFMLLVPRRAEADGPVGCNSVAFAGSIFVRSKEEIAYVAGKGPLPILAAVGFEWWS